MLGLCGRVDARRGIHRHAQGDRMTVRLLANENFPRPALLALRKAGVDVEPVDERCRWPVTLTSSSMRLKTRFRS